MDLSMGLHWLLPFHTLKVDTYPDSYDAVIAASAIQYISGTGTKGATTLTSVGQPTTAVTAPMARCSTADDSSSTSASSSSSAGAVKVGFGADSMAAAAPLI